MDFIVNQKPLKTELGHIMGSVEKKTTIPALSNVLVETGPEQIRLTGTDYELSLRTQLPARIQQKGKACVSAQKLFDIVKLLPDTELEFKTDDKHHLHIKSGKSKFRLAGIDPSTYPAIPEHVSMVDLNAEMFRKMIGQTSFTGTKEQFKFDLNGVQFKTMNGRFVMAATNMYRMSRTEGLATDLEFEIKIPRRALGELAKALDGDTLNFGFTDNHIFFRSGDRSMSCRRMSAGFPDYELAISPELDKSLTVDLDTFRQAVQRVALTADTRLQSIDVFVRENEIELIGESADFGESSDVIPCVYSGPDLHLGYNHTFLTDYLAAVDGQTITIRLKDNSERSEFIVDDDTSYRYIVWPLRTARMRTVAATN